jgi:hypothetical protein
MSPQARQDDADESTANMGTGADYKEYASCLLAIVLSTVKPGGLGLLEVLHDVSSAHIHFPKLSVQYNALRNTCRILQTESCPVTLG